MSSPEDQEAEEEAGKEESRRMFEPLYEKARQSKYGLLHFGGGSYAVIVRAYCSSTAKRRRRPES